MKRILTKIETPVDLGPDLRSFWLQIPDAGNAQPGQFFEFATGSRFLRRAISVADRDEDRLRFVVKMVGYGTRWLGALPEGSEVDVTGPLGKGAPMPDEGKVVLLGGGVGSAPLLYLARVLKDRGISVTALLGAASRNELILVDEFTNICSDVRLATDDGSIGSAGNLVELLSACSDLDDSRCYYTCGPEPMLKTIKEIGLNKPCYAFLESRMGCGTGLCVGCAVKDTEDKYRRVCMDGPVFELSEIEI